MAEVSRFERFCDGANRTDIGLAQFHAHESSGIKPENTDAYFLRLLAGKRWWEWQLNEYAEAFDRPNGEGWPGMGELERNYAGDPAAIKQIRKRIGLRRGHLISK